MRNRRFFRMIMGAGLGVSTALVAGIKPAAAERPVIDTHIHYSHDAWAALPPAAAIRVLRKAGLKRAFVSSSSDEGTQKLYKLAPKLIVPVLRPYRRRGEISTWFTDETVLAMLAGRLKKNLYAGIGELHINGKDADSTVMRGVVQLAKQYKIFIHLHGDTEAVNRVFAQDPGATVLWAHSGFAQPETIGAMLAKHKRLWSDLAFRTEHYSGGSIDPEWKKLFVKFPGRFTLGTDTFAPSRWDYVEEHAKNARVWLKALPADIADRIAFRNAETLAGWALKGKE